MFQVKWDDTTSSLAKLRDEFKLCWECLTKINPGRFPHCEEKMKSVDDRLKVMGVVHRRILNRFNKLYLFMGMDPKEQMVHVVQLCA